MKVNSKFCFAAYEGSVLGTVLFDNNLCGFFFIMNDVDFASNADDNTLSFADTDMDDVISKLRNALETLLKWYNNSQTKAHLGSLFENLFGVFFGNKLTFQSRIVSF